MALTDLPPRYRDYPSICSEEAFDLWVRGEALFLRTFGRVRWLPLRYGPAYVAVLIALALCFLVRLLRGCLSGIWRQKEKPA